MSQSITNTLERKNTAGHLTTTLRQGQLPLFLSLSCAQRYTWCWVSLGTRSPEVDMHKRELKIL
jgi:hypothetical protein